jgi:hypothetical protein
MTTVQTLISDVETARDNYFQEIAHLAEIQSSWKPTPDIWNITEITEHLYWAEQGAICGMWKTLIAIRENNFGKSYESANKNLPIEKIIELTWQAKEKVPPVAAPRFGGSLVFWKLSLKSLREILQEFGDFLQDNELRMLAHPHPISGPLDFQQRIEFIRFHIDRHRQQVSELLKAMKADKTVLR